MKNLILCIAALAIGTAAVAATPVITLTPVNLLTLKEQVSDESVGPIILQLMMLPGNEVTLYINSPGGSIIAGNNLINAIHASGKKVTCIAEFAASMAFSILQACTVRYTVPGSIIMQHQASYEVKGNVSEIRTQVELAEKLAKKLNNDDAARLGMPVKDFQDRIHNEWWLFDDESVQYKAADSQVYVKCSVALTNKKVVQVIDSLVGSATIVWSACPLVSYPLSIKIERKQGVDLRDYNEWARQLNFDQDWKTHRQVGK